MKERLDNLLSFNLDEVLRTKDLLMELLRLWSICFNGRKPCSTCKKEHIKYYADLKKSGYIIIEKMEKQQFLLKSNISIQTPGRIFRIDNTSDEDAIKLLRKNKKFIRSFQKYPKNWEEVIEGVKEEPKDNKLYKASIKRKITNLNKKIETVEESEKEALMAQLIELEEELKTLE